jgi:hypothetical protein
MWQNLINYYLKNKSTLLTILCSTDMDLSSLRGRGRGRVVAGIRRKVPPKRPSVRPAVCFYFQLRTVVNGGLMEG